jgi:hypothetical protein
VGRGADRDAGWLHFAALQRVRPHGGREPAVAGTISMRSLRLHGERRPQRSHKHQKGWAGPDGLWIEPRWGPEAGTCGRPRGHATLGARVARGNPLPSGRGGCQVSLQ